jgi:hypothetical protein
MGSAQWTISLHTVARPGDTGGLSKRKAAPVDTAAELHFGQCTSPEPAGES